MLTTPETKENDVVFPGENWFLYWRTSPSLWEAKLRDYLGAAPIFVPINWGYHSEYEGDLDLGEVKPENDLARLSQVASQVGRELIFLIPTTPLPFLPNGGIPAYLSRYIAQSEEGINYAVVDANQRVHHLYSFFDVKTFQAYRKFCIQVGRYFSQKGLAHEMFGCEAGYLKGSGFQSYFYDQSQVFHEGYKRYLDGIVEEGRSLPDSIEADVELKKEYCGVIKKLYLDVCEEAFSGHWGGELQFSFVGGAVQDIFSRTSEIIDQREIFFKTVFDTVISNTIPSTILLPTSLKNTGLNRAMNDVVTEGYIRSRVDSSLYEGDWVSDFSPLVLFEFLPNEKSGHATTQYRKTGLKSFLDSQYRWVYQQGVALEQVDDELAENRIYCFHSDQMQAVELNQMLRLFMNGAKIFFDCAYLAPDLLKKIEIFCTENDLTTQKVHYLCPVSQTTLGDGSLIIYNSQELVHHPYNKQLSFWQRLTQYMDIKHIGVECDDDVFYFWKNRSSSPYELQYEEIRRVSIYNPSSYKKKVRVLSNKNFALAKIVDQVQTEFKNGPIGVELFMLPGGSISLDFGYFET